MRLRAGPKSIKGKLVVALALLTAAAGASQDPFGSWLPRGRRSPASTCSYQSTAQRLSPLALSLPWWVSHSQQDQARQGP